jgi:DNA-binding protein H-NS
MQSFGLTTEDYVNFMGDYKPKRTIAKAVPKYKDPASGITWSGRGKAPAWIKGQDYTKFLI